MELIALKEANNSGQLEVFLKQFVDKSSQKTDFNDVDYFVRQEIVKLIEKESAQEKWSLSLASVFMNVIRLICRDEKNVEVLFQSEKVKQYILSLAELPNDPSHPVNFMVKLEAIKCLVNVLYRSQEMRNSFGKESQEGIKLQLTGYVRQTVFSKDEAFCYTLLLKILFISTALQENMRALWSQTSFYSLLIGSLEQSLALLLLGIQDMRKELESRVSEVLKTIFNLFCKVEPNDDVSAMTLKVGRKILFSGFAEDPEVCQNCVNLIFTLPVTLSVVCPPVKEVEKSLAQFEDHDMSIMKILLDKMEERIDSNEMEMISMYITALLRYCVTSQKCRRFVRLIILPPLKDIDVARHPDEGDSLRNKLIRIMKSVGNAGTVASELMFVLCKRSVSRMIKYTGFGHSAGVLANAGLLGQINTPKSDENSEDSETEEYASVENRVNPVTGCIRPTNAPNPFEGMTDEQKEYEAMKLMNNLNEMLDSGLVKPATIGEDGKARPLKHVLELAKDLPDAPDDTDSE